MTQPDRPLKKPMSTGTILLISGGLFFFVCAAGIGGAAYWFSSNKGQMLAEGKEAQGEAQTFAASHDQNACIDEGLARTGRCEGIGFRCAVQQQLFLGACLRSASESAGLCTGVPKASEIMASASWSTTECRKRGRNDQLCPNMMQAVPRYCESK